MPPRRRSFLIAALGSMGLILVTGAGSTVIAQTAAVEMLGELEFAFLIAGLTFAWFLALLVLRLLGRWPFDALPDDVPEPSAALTYGAMFMIDNGGTPTDPASIDQFIGQNYAAFQVYSGMNRFPEVKDWVQEQMATNPIGPAPQNTNITDLAGWTVLANVVLNLDETLARP